MAVGMLMPTSPSRMCPRGGWLPALRAAFTRLATHGGGLRSLGCPSTEDDVARAALNCPPVAPAQPGGPGGWRGPGRPGRQAGHAASAVQRAIVAHPVSLPQFADAHTHQLPAAELRDQRADAGA